MYLSDHFTLRELTFSDTAQRLGIDNTPSLKVRNALRRVCEAILEPVREHYGKPFRPNSGYRSPTLNATIGGSAKSQHMVGEAVDLEVPGVSTYDLAYWIRDNLKFDQLILEFYTPGSLNSGWVHVSFKQVGKRGQCLTAVKEKGRVVYKQGLHR